MICKIYFNEVVKKKKKKLCDLAQVLELLFVSPSLPIQQGGEFLVLV